MILMKMENWQNEYLLKIFIPSSEQLGLVNIFYNYYRKITAVVMN